MRVLKRRGEDIPEEQHSPSRKKFTCVEERDTQMDSGCVTSVSYARVSVHEDPLWDALAPSNESAFDSSNEQ